MSVLFKVAGGIEYIAENVADFFGITANRFLDILL
jgi:hypothetical protein